MPVPEVGSTSCRRAGAPDLGILDHRQCVQSDGATGLARSDDPDLLRRVPNRRWMRMCGVLPMV
jgi:hypothetical protein